IGVLGTSLVGELNRLVLPPLVHRQRRAGLESVGEFLPVPDPAAIFVALIVEEDHAGRFGAATERVSLPVDHRIGEVLLVRDGEPDGSVGLTDVDPADVDDVELGGRGGRTDEPGERASYYYNECAEGDRIEAAEPPDFALELLVHGK